MAVARITDLEERTNSWILTYEMLRSPSTGSVTFLERIQIAKFYNIMTYRDFYTDYAEGGASLVSENLKGERIFVHKNGKISRGGTKY